jgi:aryl-alcohol dehydrogenase-like predicted oxidoreductase
MLSSHRLPEKNGLLAAAHERGIVPLAYSPLGQGRLSGKYSSENPPPSGRRFSDYPMSSIDPLVNVMREIAEKRDVPVSCVGLNWIMCKGVIPLPGARNAKQAEQNSRALGWRLDADEIAKLEAHSMEGKTSFWQQG